MPNFDKDTTELITFLGKRVGDLTKTLNNFKKGIGTEDWALSMERSHGAFEAAARHSVFLEVLTALTTKDSRTTIESLHEYATREMHRLASKPHHSSSPTANIMHGETLAAWVDLLECLPRVETAKE
jgi:hypothetical protein